MKITKKYLNEIIREELQKEISGRTAGAMLGAGIAAAGAAKGVHGLADKVSVSVAAQDEMSRNLGLDQVKDINKLASFIKQNNVEVMANDTRPYLNAKIIDILKAKHGGLKTPEHLAMARQEISKLIK